MFKPGTPSIEQIRTFLAVVEEGSFAAAGRRLHRATSVVSYAIANLEAQLGVTLFSRAGTKKPRLTPAGEAVLEELRQVERGLESLRARVGGLVAGLEPRVALVVDVMFPMPCLAAALRDFAATFPSVALSLRIEALGAVADAVVVNAGAFRKACKLVDKAGEHVFDGVAGIEQAGFELALLEEDFFQATFGVVQGALRQRFINNFADNFNLAV